MVALTGLMNELTVPSVFFSRPYATHAWSTIAALQKAGKKIDVAVLPIGGYQPYIRAHASPEQAWQMFCEIGAEYLIPIHHGTFILSYEPPDEPLQRLLAVAGKGMPFAEALKKADEVLLNATRGISELITVSGLINVDFADVRTVMREMGDAIMGSGVATGENRAVEAAHAAISSPLLEDVSISGAQGVLVNITGGTGSGQVRIIEDYVGSTKVATVDSAWTTAPKIIACACTSPRRSRRIRRSTMVILKS